MSSSATPSQMITVIFVTFMMKQLLFPISTSAAALKGEWQMLQESVGVSAMHMQLLHNDHIILFDRTEWGPSNISLPKGKKCRRMEAGWDDCTAHSVEYNVLSNTFRPLTLLTDTLCSSGAVDLNGRLMQTGGFEKGYQVIRLFTPCGDKSSLSSSCDWVELKDETLLRPRWYATNHLLPDGRQTIIVGGIGQPNYEFYPKTESTKGLFQLRFLYETTDGNGVNNNLYPFVFLNTDGNLFIFANTRSILLDYKNNKVVRQDYPAMPDGNPRNYPSTGSAVLLPLKDLDSSQVVQAEVFICGGAPKGAYDKAQKGVFLTALNTCGRMKINDPLPKWEIETMPMPRVMSDMLLLPNEQVLIINGCESGSASFGLCRKAQHNPIIYKPNQKTTSVSRFEIQNPSPIPRVYHSTAVLLRDGRVLVGGSNTQGGYRYSGVLFPTLLSLEAFKPGYLDISLANLRPKILSPTTTQIKHGQVFKIVFTVNAGLPRPTDLKVTMNMPPFNTHSFSQGQRMLILTQLQPIVQLGHLKYQVTVKSPRSGNLAPAGYYILFVVNQGVPSEGIWVRCV